MIPFTHFQKHRQLREMPLPQQWQRERFRINGSFDNHSFGHLIDYILERPEQPRIAGMGSSRTAFELQYNGRKTVLKVAHNEKGMAQNKVECELMFDNHYFDTLGLFPPGIDYDQDNPSPVWLHMEYAGPCSYERFVEACGGGPIALVKYAQIKHKAPSMTREPGVWNTDWKRIDPRAWLTKAFVDFTKNWPDLLEDYTGLSNWGWYDGHPVIVDVGYNWEVGKNHYGADGQKVFQNGRTVGTMDSIARQATVNKANSAAFDAQPPAEENPNS